MKTYHAQTDAVSHNNGEREYNLITEGDTEPESSILEDSGSVRARPQASQKRPKMLSGAVYHQVAYEQGEDIARASGDTKPDPVTEGAIKKSAGAQARGYQRLPFDPTTSAHDARLQGEMDDRLEQRQEAREGVQFAGADVHECEAALSHAQIVETISTNLRWVLTAAGVIGFSICFIITYHDMFFVFSDQFLSWTVSTLAAVVTGLSVSLFILAESEDGHRSALNYLGLSAGLLIALAFCGIRLKDATSSSEVIFAVSLLIFEIGLVLGLEGAARGLRQAAQTLKEQQQAQAEALALLDAAQAHYDRRVAALETVEAQIEDDILTLEMRELCATGVDALEESLVASALAGYHAGILANKARLRAATSVRRLGGGSRA